MKISSQKLVALLTLATVMGTVAWSTTSRVWAQTSGDVVIIGDSPGQRERLRGYWNDLVRFNRSRTPVGQQQPAAAQPTAGASESGQETIRNLEVNSLVLQPIIKLNGSSQVIGVLTNRNPFPVKVAGVNFEVLDLQGNLLRTGSARPAPSTLQPGQSVTFTETLLTIPPDIGARLRLAEPAIALDTN